MNRMCVGIYVCRQYAHVSVCIQCICVCVYTVYVGRRIHVCIYAVSVYVCTVSVCIRIYVYIARVCIYVHAHVHIQHTCVRVGMCMHMCAHSICMYTYICICTVQFSSVAQSCPTLCDPMNRSTPGLPVHHQLPEFTQTHVQ